MNTCAWNVTPTCPSLDNPSYLHIETLRIHNTIRTKCLRAKVPPAWQLEEIFCTPQECAHQFLPGWPQESCWEIKQILREAEVTMLWNWPEVCSSLATVTPLLHWGYKHRLKVNLLYYPNQSVRSDLKQSGVSISWLGRRGSNLLVRLMDGLL